MKTIIKELKEYKGSYYSKKTRLCRVFFIFQIPGNPMPPFQKTFVWKNHGLIM